MKSFRELRVWQKVTRLKYLRSDQLVELLPEISALGKQLYALRNALLRG